MALPKSDDVKSWSKVKHGNGFKRHSPGIKSRRKRRNKSNIIIPVLNGCSNDNISFKSLRQKIMKETQLMKHTQLFKQFMIHFKSIASSNYRSLTDNNDSLCAIKVNIICYALGSFSKSLSSMKQISFLCCIIDDFKNKNCNHNELVLISFECGTIELFEPLLSLTERKILKYFGINVLLRNNMAKYTMNHKDDHVITLSYMPHSPRVLYNNLLGSNWSQYTSLSKMYIIGNSFEQYHDLHFSTQKDINWILLSKKMNVLEELNMDKWICADDSIQNRSTQQRDTRDITMNAFAFQKLMYFPIQKIQNHTKYKWVETAKQQSKFHN